MRPENINLAAGFQPTQFSLHCQGCGEYLETNTVLLNHSGCIEPGLLRADYDRQQLTDRGEESGLFRYADWLPVKHFLTGSGYPVTYRSSGLSNRLGLKNLFITFCGFWPERNANMLTGTFKECEAYSVCASMEQDGSETLVVASAGNTARAFAKVCSDNRIPVIIVVPEQNLPALWFIDQVNSNVRLVVAGGDSDYYDAIKLADLICQHQGFMPEGGAKNIARRDGMGTTLLSATVTIGQLPDYYFQAVGSGTGSIAAWEAGIRLSRDGRFGTNIPRLVTSQNSPFLPIHDAWQLRQRNLVDTDSEIAHRQVEAIWAKVLSNRQPPYGIPGGLYDALVDTDGLVLAVDNTAARAAAELFQELEGNDIAPAAAVALASLIQAVEMKIIDSDAVIMLNITGGGIERLKRMHRIYHLQPHLTIPREKINPDEIELVVTRLNKEI